MMIGDSSTEMAGNIVETPATAETLSEYAAFLQGFYTKAGRRQAFFPAAHILIWTYFIDLHKKFVFGADAKSFWAQPSAVKDLWACFFASITLGLCHRAEAGDWTFTELVDSCSSPDTTAAKICTGIYAYLGKALLDALLNMAYVGSAKDKAEQPSEYDGGFYCRESSHNRDKVHGVNPFHRE